MSEAEPKRRDACDEGDIDVLTCNERFSTAVHAYGRNHCSLSQMARLAFERPPFLPRNLGMLAFADLVLELVRRIHAGELMVRDSAKRMYQEFYRDLPLEPGQLS